MSGPFTRINLGVQRTGPGALGEVILAALYFIGRYAISYDLNKENETVRNREKIRY